MFHSSQGWDKANQTTKLAVIRFITITRVYCAHGRVWRVRVLVRLPKSCKHHLNLCSLRHGHKAATTSSIHLHSTADLRSVLPLWSPVSLEKVFPASSPHSGKNPRLLVPFLQKTNIIRDFRGDVVQKRFFWPREWLTTDALDYWEEPKHVCVIPAAMAIPNCVLWIRQCSKGNYRNIKIRKAEAAKVVVFFSFFLLFSFVLNSSSSCAWHESDFFSRAQQMRLSRPLYRRPSQDWICLRLSAS